MRIQIQNVFVADFLFKNNILSFKNRRVGFIYARRLCCCLQASVTPVFKKFLFSSVFLSQLLKLYCIFSSAAAINVEEKRHNKGPLVARG